MWTFGCRHHGGVMSEFNTVHNVSCTFRSSEIEKEFDENGGHHSLKYFSKQKDPGLKLKLV
jgi:hypothetical protein